MKQKDKFRFAEKCLYGYKRNIAGLDVLQEDLRVAKASTDVHVQNYQFSFGFNGEPSNPEEARLIKIESIEERIHKLERITEPITRMIADLNVPETLEGSTNKILYEILKLMYFGKNIPEVIISELNLSKRMFFYRRSELVMLTVDYLAL